MVADGSGGVDPELGLEASLADEVREHGLRGRASADVTFNSEKANASMQ